MCAPLLDAARLARLREDFGEDWDIYRDRTGRLVAEHLREEPDAARERWVIKTRLSAATCEELRPRLIVQQAVRGAEVPT